MTATITPIPLGPLQTNGYLISSNGHAVMVDPGGDAHIVIAEIERHGFTLDAIWLTHAHFDHVGGIAELQAKYPVPLRMHAEGAIMLQRSGESARLYGLPFTDPPQEYQAIDTDEVLTIGNTKAVALLTPGHAPGHLSFYFAEEGVVLSGDALFQRSIGRTDIPLANQDTLLASIQTQLFTLPDETVVLSGHGAPTTIGDERAHNPFLTGL